MDNSVLDCETRIEHLYNGIRHIHPVHGFTHRTDGPAVVFNSGEAVWYINGTWYPFETWCKVLNKTPAEITALRIEYGIT